MMRTLDEIKTYCVDYFNEHNTTAGLILPFAEKRLLYEDLNLNTIRECVTQLVYGGIDTCSLCDNKILVGPPAADIGSGFCYRHRHQCIVCGRRNNRSPKFCTAKHAYLFDGDVFYSEETQTWTAIEAGAPNITIHIDEYEVNTPYLKNTLVKYIHTSGNINPITVVYILSARADINNVIFNIFEWEIVSQKVWILDRLSFETEEYQIFPGDALVINSENKIIINSHNGIINSALLLSEFDEQTHRHIGSGVSSIQLESGQNIIYTNLPVFFDESSYGIVDNHLINGARGNTILFDNIPDDFVLFMKVSVDGNPTKRITYPELPSSFSTRFYFTSNHWSLLETTDFTTVNSGSKYVSVPLTFSNDGDFYYYKFWKTSLMPKVRFIKYPINTTPNEL